MAGAEPRRRQPEETRQRLLEVAATLVAEHGLAALTLDAVAQAAGVSKGGLLHHFRSKTTLVEAMVEALNGGFFSAVRARAEADPDPHGRSARAYLHAVAAEADEGQRLAALTAALLHEPALVEAWRREMRAARDLDRAETEDPDRALLVRLAADGLWFAGLFGLYDLDPGTRRRIEEALAALTRRPGGKD